MKNASRNVLILTLILMALSIGIPAFAAGNGDSGSNPGSALDEWDDDVWSDWGAQPTTKGGAPEDSKDGTLDNIPPKDTASAGGGSFGGGTFGGGSNSFGESDSKIRFNLVREGYSEPKGVRKFRPKYGKRTL